MSKFNADLSIRAKQIEPSPTLSLTATAQAMRAAGQDVYSFGAGEPDMGTPAFIKEACTQALKEGKTQYTPVAGIPELRTAMAEKYVHENGLSNVTADQVVVTHGCKHACYLGLLAVCNPGDEVLIPAPYWVSYPEMVKLVGATPRILKTDETTGFKLTPELLRTAITPKTRLLILNSPSNPTGAVYRRDELEALLEVVLKAGLYVLSDEIYEELLYDGATHHSPAAFSNEAAKSVITVSGFSKSYAMTGWRLGTLVATLPVAKAVARLQSHTASNTTAFAQYGALAALKQPDKARAELESMRTIFGQRRSLLYEALTAIDGIRCQKALGAFYLFPNIAALGMTSDIFCKRLLDETQVAVVPGSAFGSDDCVRLSYATGEAVIQKGLERLKAFVDKLKGSQTQNSNQLSV